LALLWFAFRTITEFLHRPLNDLGFSSFEHILCNQRIYDFTTVAVNSLPHRQTFFWSYSLWAQLQFAASANHQKFFCFENNVLILLCYIKKIFFLFFCYYSKILLYSWKLIYFSFLFSGACRFGINCCRNSSRHSMFLRPPHTSPEQKSQSTWNNNNISIPAGTTSTSG
jgi:hypothetical protein